MNVINNDTFSLRNLERCQHIIIGKNKREFYIRYFGIIYYYIIRIPNCDMEFVKSQTNESQQSVEFVLHLDNIDNLVSYRPLRIDYWIIAAHESISGRWIMSSFVLLLKDSCLNFPLMFRVNVEFNGATLNVEDVFITLTDMAGTINLNIPLNFPLNKFSDNLASHPMLSNKN